MNCTIKEQETCEVYLLTYTRERVALYWLYGSLRFVKDTNRKDRELEMRDLLHYRFETVFKDKEIEELPSELVVNCRDEKDKINELVRAVNKLIKGE